MFKALGAILIVLASGLFSFEKAEQQKRLFENLQQMKKALFFMKHEIAFLSSEPAVIADNIAKASKGDAAQFFQSLSQCLSKQETKAYGECWQTAKKQTFQTPFLSREADNLFDAFSKQIGTMSKEMELEHLDKTIKEVQQLETAEKERYLKNKKMIYALGLVSSAGVLILLL